MPAVRRNACVGHLRVGGQEPKRRHRRFDCDRGGSAPSWGGAIRPSGVSAALALRCACMPRSSEAHLPAAPRIAFDAVAANARCAGRPKNGSPVCHASILQFVCLNAWEAQYTHAPCPDSGWMTGKGGAAWHQQREYRDGECFKLCSIAAAWMGRVALPGA